MNDERRPSNGTSREQSGTFVLSERGTTAAGRDPTDGLKSDEAGARVEGTVLASLISALRQRGRPLGASESKAIHVALACARFLRDGAKTPDGEALIDGLYDVLRSVSSASRRRAGLAAAHQAVRETFERWRTHPFGSEESDVLLADLRDRLANLDARFRSVPLTLLREDFVRHDRDALDPSGTTAMLTAVLASECGAFDAASRGRVGGSRGLGVGALRRAIEAADPRAA